MLPDAAAARSVAHRGFPTPGRSLVPATCCGRPLRGAGRCGRTDRRRGCARRAHRRASCSAPAHGPPLGPAPRPARRARGRAAARTPRAPAAPADCPPSGRGTFPRHWLGCAADPGPARPLGSDERIALGPPRRPEPRLRARARLRARPLAARSRPRWSPIVRGTARSPTVESLLRVRGIGPKRLAQARAALVVGTVATCPGAGVPCPAPPGREDTFWSSAVNAARHLYELDEALLAPEGSAVQCTRCDHVFTARPPMPGDRVEERPAAIDTAAVAAAAERASAPSRTSRSPRRWTRPLQSPSERRPSRGRSRSALAPPAHEPRHARGATPSVYRPAPGPGCGAHAPRPAPRHGRRVRVAAPLARARLRWLAPAVALGALVLAAGGWFLLRGRVDPDAASARAGGARARRARRCRQPRPRDRALRRRARTRAAAPRRRRRSRARAGHAGDRARGGSQGLAARRAARARWSASGSRASNRRAGRTRSAPRRARPRRSRPRPARSRTVRGRSSSSAREALRPLERAGRRTTPPSCARSPCCTSRPGSATQRSPSLAPPRSPGERDPWLDLADAALDAAEPQSAARERAVAKLAAIATRSPELLRARYLLARTQAALGRVEEASATVDRLLAANPAPRGRTRAARCALRGTRPPRRRPAPQLRTPGLRRGKPLPSGASAQSAPPAAQGGAHVPSAPAPGPAAARPATAPIGHARRTRSHGGSARRPRSPRRRSRTSLPRRRCRKIAPLGVSQGTGHRLASLPPSRIPIGGG